MRRGRLPCPCRQLPELRRRRLHPRHDREDVRRPQGAPVRMGPDQQPGQGRQGLHRGPPRPHPRRRPAARGREGLLRRPRRPGGRRQRVLRPGGRPVQVLLLHEPRRSRFREEGRRAGRAAFRRVHPRRLLLRQHEDRLRHRREGRPLVDRLPAGPDGRRRGEPDPEGRQGREPQDQGRDQVPELVRALPGPRLRPGQGAEDVRRDLHGHRDPRPGLHRPVPPAVRELPDHPLLREHQAGRQRRRLGGHLRLAVRRPLRGAALGHDVCEGPRDHPLQLAPHPSERRLPATARTGKAWGPASISTR